MRRRRANRRRRELPLAPHSPTHFPVPAAVPARPVLTLPACAAAAAGGGDRRVLGGQAGCSRTSRTTTPAPGRSRPSRSSPRSSVPPRRRGARAPQNPAAARRPCGRSAPPVVRWDTQRGWRRRAGLVAGGGSCRSAGGGGGGRGRVCWRSPVRPQRKHLRRLLLSRLRLLLLAAPPPRVCGPCDLLSPASAH